MKLRVVVPEISFFVSNPVYLTLMARNPNYKEVDPLILSVSEYSHSIVKTVKNGVTDITYLKILNIKHKKKQIRKIHI